MHGREIGLLLFQPAWLIIYLSTIAKYLTAEPAWTELARSPPRAPSPRPRRPPRRCRAPRPPAVAAGCAAHPCACVPGRGGRP